MESDLYIDHMPFSQKHQSQLFQMIFQKFLRVAAIYGANASGKSNLYLAMYFFQRIIIN